MSEFIHFGNKSRLSPNFKREHGTKLLRLVLEMNLISY